MMHWGSQMVDREASWNVFSWLYLSQVGVVWHQRNQSQALFHLPEHHVNSDLGRELVSQVGGRELDVTFPREVLGKLGRSDIQGSLSGYHPRS